MIVIASWLGMRRANRADAALRIDFGYRNTRNLKTANDLVMRKALTSHSQGAGLPPDARSPLASAAMKSTY
jgi:hypothetical protein